MSDKDNTYSSIVYTVANVGLSEYYHNSGFHRPSAIWILTEEQGTPKDMGQLCLSPQPLIHTSVLFSDSQVSGELSRGVSSWPIEDSPVSFHRSQLLIIRGKFTQDMKNLVSTRHQKPMQEREANFAQSEEPEAISLPLAQPHFNGVQITQPFEKGPTLDLQMFPKNGMACE